MARAARLIPLLILALAATASAQVTGSIDSVGLAGYVRPGAWTPLLVKLTPTGGASANYVLRVRQLDLDGDAVTFDRTIPVTGNAGGSAGRDQYFWTYFKPEPIGAGGTRGGLAGEQDLGRFNERLAVTVHRDAGGGVAGEEVARLAASNAPLNVDADPERGTRLVVFVGDRSPPLGGYDGPPGQVVGVLESLAPALVQARDLPDDVRGYDAADAVVLLGSAVDYDALTSGGRLDAIKAFVRRGGRLVICQPTDQFQQALRLGDLMPVTVASVEEAESAAGLRALALPRESATAEGRRSAAVRAWDTLPGPVRLAVARSRDGTLTDATAALGDGRTVPLLARMPYGTGGVTWLGTDPTDPALRPGGSADGARAGPAYQLPGWATLWAAVLGYADAPAVDPTKAQRAPYESLGYSTRDFGRSLLADMNLSARTTGYVALAVIFFLGYWAAAGPGLHLFLVAKGKPQLSWFLFGAAAVVATALTLLVVRLVLRGPPEARHLTVARAVSPERIEAVASAPPAVAHARLGVYVPRDGPQVFDLPDAGPTSTVTPYPLDPSQFDEPPPVTGTAYAVSVVGPSASGPPPVAVPYRSTLKKLAVTRVGPLDGRVSGKVTLRPGTAGYVEGTLSNDTGRDLRNAYVAFRHPQARGAAAGTFVIYQRRWDAGTTIDLTGLFALPVKEFPILSPANGAVPGAATPRLRGTLENDWVPYWYRGLAVGGFGGGMGSAFGDYDDFGADVRPAYPLLSFFGALPPMANAAQAQQPTRADLLRRGARDWDASAALTAGAMVVVAESPGPPPFPITVEGRPLTAEGTTVYQFVLPTSRSGLE